VRDEPVNRFGEILRRLMEEMGVLARAVTYREHLRS
jgi:hypothetical protein